MVKYFPLYKSHAKLPCATEDFLRYPGSGLGHSQEGQVPALLISPLTKLATVKAHKDAVTGVAVQVVDHERLLLVSISSDDCVHVWSNNGVRNKGNAEEGMGQASWELQQSISMPLRLQHAVAVTALPNDSGW